MKLTKQQIDDATPGTKDTYLWDQSPAGFGVRIRPSGTKTFLYRYRPGGGRAAPTRKFTIGQFGNLTVEQARKTAQQLAGHVAEGRDPVAERKEARRESEREQMTLSTVAQEFIEQYAEPRLRSADEYKRLLGNYVEPRFGTRPIHTVSRQEISGLLAEIGKKNGRRMADYVLSVLRKMMNWHETREDTYRSPIVRGMNQVSPTESARDRVLNDDEIRAVWKVLVAEPYPYGPLVRLLFLTGQRREEVAQAKWDEIVGDIWIIPPDRYKTKKEVVVPLSAAAQQLINDLPRNGPFLFTTTGETPFSGFSKAKGRLDEESGVTGWWHHDIRRTVRTLMSRAGVRPDIAERVLGHKIAGVAGVYDRYAYLDEKKGALDRLASSLETIITTPPKSNVVKFPATQPATAIDCSDTLEPVLAAAS